MPSRDEQSRRLTADTQGDLETPFLQEELFAEESEAEWEAHLPALEAESPFLHAFAGWRAHGVEPEEYGFPNEQEAEDEWGPHASALESESPFQSAFEQGLEGFGSPETEGPRSFGEGLVQEGEAGIIDQDDRVRITPTLGVPWRWICKVEVKRFSDNKLVGGGTGVLVSNRHVLTAAHVVYEASLNMQNFSIRVIPGLDHGKEPFESYSARPKLPRNYSHSAQHADRDYALLTLKSAAGKKTFSSLKGGTLCFWGSRQCGANSVFARPDPATLNGKAVFTAGYPRSVGADKLMCAAGILHSVNRLWRTMRITADTTKGQSGSPVWIVENGRFCLVGIAAGAGTGSNVVVRVTRELIRQLRTWMTEDGETPSLVETEAPLDSPAVTLSYPEAEHDQPRFTGWSPQPYEEETEDFADADDAEDHFELLYEQPLEERFDPSAVPKDVADALGKKEWALALKLAIQAGWRDVNALTNLIFFARHPELPVQPLDKNHPEFKQLSAEWAKTLNEQVWKAIEASAQNTELAVSGKEVIDHHRSFFQGKSGKRLKQLVEGAAREVGINPGLLGTIMMAETRRPLSYLSGEKVSSYHIGADDFYEARGAIKARVPAYAKVKWDKNQTPVEHLNDAKRNPRMVKTILFDSGSDAALATAVYVKFREARLREIAAELKGNFDNLPLATQFALTRMAMAAGTAGATPFLKDALKGADIFDRRNIPVRAYQTKRNATVRTAQAMHLSDWVFGVPVPAATVQPELETFERSDDEEFGDEFGHEEFEGDVEASYESVGPEPAEEELRDGDTLADEAMLWEEIAELLPDRVLPSEVGQVSVSYETPPLPRGVPSFEHWFQPMKRDKATNKWVPDGGETRLEPIDPGFFDASGELKPSPLTDPLRDLLMGNPEFSRHLSREALRDRKAKPGDKIRVALVDLTGSKLLNPEFAGWGSTFAVNGASCPKVAPLYAAFQLQNDLKHVAASEKITKTAELIRIIRERWKKEGIESPPRLEQFLYPYTDPPALEFSADVDWAINNIIHQHNANHAAMVLINAVGFPYIASLMWQSGLRHPSRGGLWLTSNYAGGPPWQRPSKPPPPPVFGHNAMALSLATFFTLLAQDRLVRTGLPRTLKTALSTASWFSDTLPSASIASKVGLLLRCLERGPKTKDGQPVLDKNNQPVIECKRSEATHVHEAGLIENDRFRYAVAIMTTGIPAGVSLLQKLIGELDGLIRRNNP